MKKYIAFNPTVFMFCAFVLRTSNVLNDKYLNIYRCILDIKLGGSFYFFIHRFDVPFLQFSLSDSFSLFDG